MKKRAIRFCAAFGAGLFLALTVVFCTGIFHSASAGNALRLLSDACFFAAVALFGSGLLVVCGNAGTFTIFSYSGRRIVSFFFPPGKAGCKRRSYREYREERDRKKTKYAHLLLAGACFFALSLMFLGAYYTV